MKTPRHLLNNLKQQGLEPYYLSVGKRLLFEMLFELQLDLFKHMDEGISEAFVEQFELNVQKMLRDEPLGYILGFEWFYGYKMIVNKHVLIPRSETEELIGHVCADIDDYFSNENIVICDIATGSGAIAVALKKENPQAIVFASDISHDAINVAKENAHINDAEIEFFIGDMALPLIDRNIKVDVCVCNPPYIRSNEDIELSVKDYEPHIALFGGVDGLDLYRRLLDQLPLILNKRAVVAFEIGYDQKDALLDEIYSRYQDVIVKTKKDINHKDRMIFIYFN